MQYSLILAKRIDEMTEKIGDFPEEIEVEDPLFTQVKNELEQTLFKDFFYFFGTKVILKSSN